MMGPFDWIEWIKGELTTPGSQALSTLVQLAGAAATGGAAVYWVALRLFTRRLRHQATEISNLKKDIAHREQTSQENAARAEALRERCREMEQRFAETAVAEAEHEWRDENYRKAQYALDHWIEREGGPISRLLLLRGDWAAGYAVGDLRAAAFAVAGTFATAALALDPRNRYALALSKEVSSLAAAEAQALPEFSAALEVLTEIGTVKHVDADRIVEAMHSQREALILEGYGHYYMANQVINRALITFREQIGRRSLQTIRADLIRCRLLHRLGRVKEALADLAELISIGTDVPGIGLDHPEIVAARRVFAECLFDAGELREAMNVAERVFTDHPEELAAGHVLARALDSLGDYEAARLLIERVITAECEAPDIGPLSYETLVSQNVLAGILCNLGKQVEAKTILERLVALETNGPDFWRNHPQALRCRSLLAQVLDSLGDYRQARILIEQVIAIEDSSPDVGPNNPETIRNRSLLAQILNHLGKNDVAKTTIEQVIAAAKESSDIGHDHIQTLSYEAQFAIILNDLGNHEDAINIITRVIELESSSDGMGPDHPKVVWHRDLLSSFLNSRVNNSSGSAER